MNKTVPKASSAPSNGRYFPKKVIKIAAKKGSTTINQVNSASTPPSVYSGLPSASKFIKF